MVRKIQTRQKLRKGANRAYRAGAQSERNGRRVWFHIEFIILGDPLIFGIFDDRIVTVGSLKELAVAVAENWDHTKKQLKSFIL